MDCSHEAVRVLDRACCAYGTRATRRATERERADPSDRQATRFSAGIRKPPVTATRAISLSLQTVKKTRSSTAAAPANVGFVVWTRCVRGRRSTTTSSLELAAESNDAARNPRRAGHRPCAAEPNPLAARVFSNQQREWNCCGPHSAKERCAVGRTRNQLVLT